LGRRLCLRGGAPNKDFNDAGTGTCTTNGTGFTYQAGGTCTVDVIFKPTLPGVRYGAVELTDNSGNAIATGYVQGTGAGPQLNFPPGTQSTLGSGLPTQWGVAADGAGNVYIADQATNAVYKETPSQGSYTQSTLVGGLSSPTGIAVDGAGAVYICSGANTVVKETLLPSGSYAQSTVDSNLEAC